jgi:hypothetical protein
VDRHFRKVRYLDLWGQLGFAQKLRIYILVLLCDIRVRPRVHVDSFALLWQVFSILLAFNRNRSQLFEFLRFFQDNSTAQLRSFLKDFTRGQHGRKLRNAAFLSHQTAFNPAKQRVKIKEQINAEADSGAWLVVKMK